MSVASDQLPATSCQRDLAAAWNSGMLRKWTMRRCGDVADAAREHLAAGSWPRWPLAARFDIKLDRGEET
jgi:hypothetical protein